MASHIETDVNRFLKSNLATQPEYVKAYIEVVSHRINRQDCGPDLDTLNDLLAELRKALEAIDQHLSA